MLLLTYLLNLVLTYVLTVPLLFRHSLNIPMQLADSGGSNLGLIILVLLADAWHLTQEVTRRGRAAAGARARSAHAIGAERAAR